MAADPPFSRMDLISCRNVLIYLAPPLQRRVIPTFHYALNPLGFLLLGLSETVGGFADMFEVADSRHRIYRKKASGSRQYPHFSSPGGQAVGMAPDRHDPSTSRPVPDRQRHVDHLLLGQYAPPGVLVNDDLEVLEFRGRTGPYLELAPGEPSLNLLRLARDGLLLDLQALFAECRRQDAPAVRQGVRVRAEGRVREIDLRCLPVKTPGDVMRCWLILFEERRSVAAHGSRDIASDAGPNPRGPARPGPTPGCRDWSAGWPGGWDGPRPPATRRAEPPRDDDGHERGAPHEARADVDARSLPVHGRAA